MSRTSFRSRTPPSVTSPIAPSTRAVLHITSPKWQAGVRRIPTSFMTNTARLGAAGRAPPHPLRGPRPPPGPGRGGCGGGREREPPPPAGGPPRPLANADQAAPPWQNGGADTWSALAEAKPQARRLIPRHWGQVRADGRQANRTGFGPREEQLGQL